MFIPHCNFLIINHDLKKKKNRWKCYKNRKFDKYTAMQ